MAAAPQAGEFISTVFETPSIRIGKFRCHPDHPAFHDSGPARACCFVFPRTAVEIHHEHERAFAANPNLVTFYNQGQQYRRRAISVEGDRCEWFGVDSAIVRDVVRTFDPAVDNRPEYPFRLQRAFSDARTFLLQRQFFDRVARGAAASPLEVEETVVALLERVVRAAYGAQPAALAPVQRDRLHHVELLLSAAGGRAIHLRDLARESGLSVYHLCRTFRRATGRTLHQYRQQVRLRWALEAVCDSDARLIDIAIDAGFSSHSHFTEAFRRQFGKLPSAVRTAGAFTTAQLSDSRAI